MKVVSPIFLAAALAVSAVSANTDVSVCRDATYSMLDSRGPICAGSGDVPTGTACPIKGDVATSDCQSYLPSYGDAQCTAHENAECVIVGGNTWGCVFPSIGCAGGDTNSTNYPPSATPTDCGANMPATPPGTPTHMTPEGQDSMGSHPGDHSNTPMSSGGQGNTPTTPEGQGNTPTTPGGHSDTPTTPEEQGNMPVTPMPTRPGDHSNSPMTSGGHSDTPTTPEEQGNMPVTPMPVTPEAQGYTPTADQGQTPLPATPKPETSGDQSNTALTPQGQASMNEHP